MLRPFLLGLLLCCSAPAFAIYKCEIGGKVTYSDAPCPGGKVLDIDSASPPDAVKASRRAVQEKNHLKQIENNRRKQEEKENKAQQRTAKINAAKQKKCTALARRRKWAEDDVASAPRKSADKAKRKAQRAAEQYQEECGKPYGQELSIAG